MKLFQVKISTIAIVAAKDADHAYEVAEAFRHEAFSDDANPRIEVDCEVKSVANLRHGWDGECIPYGGDGNTRIGALLTHNDQHNRTGKAQL